ncbi:hypothetical protein O4215_20675 [Rhodococcus maanshanensis]|uniref:phage major capsid protein n=1 Tax=Rhodococcus maanshanensis TaxID=183556 RepID=UPI0022B4D2A4|nr:hypothetical protein [Rhodococcus maanshanensis]MCZ4557980.1 hypothetical protein [Rhodococcus maanshanensis]
MASTVDSFIPELWSAGIEVPFAKAVVFAQPKVANTKYEGQIKQAGDTVKVNTVGRPTIRKFDAAVDLTYEKVTTTAQNLVIDQGEYFGIEVDDLDAVQAAGDFEQPAIAEAGIGLKDAVDTYIAGLFKGGALAANRLGSLKVLDGDPDKLTVGQMSAYQVLVKLAEKLNKASVPEAGRYVGVPPEFVSALLMDKRYTDLSNSGSTDALLNGQVGRGAGFEVLVSNNIQKVGGAGADKDDLVLCAGINAAISFANQLTKVEALRSEHRFADKVRGLNIYGAKVFRPEALATATVSFVPVA